jgi:subtilisin family serine protease
VLAPTNVSGAVVPTNADSTAPAGRPDAGATFWRMASSPLDPGQTTGSKALTFSLPAKASQVRFAFQLQAVVPDSARPPMPSGWLERPDTLVSVQDQTDASVKYFRHRFVVAFEPTASGASVRDVLTRYNATIVGGIPSYRPRGAYVIALPDPGPTYTAWQAVYDNLDAEPDIASALSVDVGRPLKDRSRYPNDGPGLGTGDWMARTDLVQPWLAIRAPQAWGCETGIYSNARVKVGIIDNLFATPTQDLAKSLFRFQGPRNFKPYNWAVEHPILRSHGTSVTSLVVAAGDDGSGTAGMLWGADVTQYAFSSGTDLSASTSLDLFQHVQDAISTGVKILVLTTGAESRTNARWIRDFEAAFRDYFEAGGYLVLATGNDTLTLTLQALKGGTDPSLNGTRIAATDIAAARLRDQYPNQLYFVAATDRAGGRLAVSNFWTGGVEVMAPGERLRMRARTADFPAGYRDGTGSSYAAPLIAGLIGQLLSVDPSLSPADVHHYLTQGALVPRRDSLTGGFISPQPVANAPGTVYQMDAYGSLSLLAQERPNLPVCGYSIGLPK